MDENAKNIIKALVIGNVAAAGIWVGLVVWMKKYLQNVEG